ncbi:MAG: V-type ATP synthase subunit D [Desulfurococcales archaeon]|uniref:A-type ATP synthase subunit D n=1 Tax=Fervidicoccus fontis TaxID=683846 RepID=A0A7J3SN94_9CREN|nr:V-type ATP synthase subunit D [Desulfurococcales archaeon]
MSSDKRGRLPTKINLIKLKRDLALIRRIRKVLDEKRSALLLYIRSMIDEYEKLYAKTSEDLKRAYQRFGEVLVEVGMKRSLEASYSVPPRLSISIKTKLVFSVRTPYLSLNKDSIPQMNYPADLPPSFFEAREELANAFEKLLKLIELENSIYTLIAELKSTQRLINSIDYAIMPDYERTIKYISLILDERMREEFTRLKVLKAKRESSSGTKR